MAEERRNAPLQSATAAIAIPGALFALGAGLISTSFPGAVVLMTVSLPLFWGMVFHAFGPRERSKKLLGIGASILIYGAMIWLIWVPVDVKTEIKFDYGYYPTDQQVNGIRWKKEYSAIIVELLNQSENNYKDVDMYLWTYHGIIDGAGIASGINACVGESWFPVAIGVITFGVVGTEQNPLTIPLTAASGRKSEFWRVHCDQLGKRSQIEIIFPVIKPAELASGDSPVKGRPQWEKLWVSAISNYRTVSWDECEGDCDSAFDLLPGAKTPLLWILGRFIFLAGFALPFPF